MNIVSSVPEFVKNSVQNYMAIWENSSINYNDLDLPKLTTIDTFKKQDHSKLLDDIIVKVKSQNLDAMPDEESLKCLFIETFQCDPDVILSKQYKNATLAFVQKAHEFDRKISSKDVYQAVRNFWIANSFQYLIDEDIKLTAPVYAYSMLYPYSDNLLDDSQICLSDKKEFNSRFRQRLTGTRLSPKHPTEEKIFQLVEMIEKHYSRELFPRVYESLLAIHSGQEKSILLKSGDPQVILSTTFEKGGTSVLADGFLVSGNLTVDQADFMMGYGIFLQLMDDLQDIEEDSLQNQTTIFTNFIGHSSFDEPVVRLIDFMLKTVRKGELIFNGKQNFFKVIRNCSLSLMSRSIHKNRQFFSRGFVKYFENTTGFSNEKYLIQKRKFETLSKKEFESYFQNMLNKHRFSETINF